jgi:mannan endo-1,4-beta-mannosidase
MKIKVVVLTVLAVQLAFAVQYQATSATLSGGATVSGDYVQMKEGDMSFNSVNASQAGMYDIRIRYKQDNDATKKQYLDINGTRVGEVEFPRTASWKDVVIVARLNSGTNKVAIIKSWGYVDIQYIDVVPHVNAPFDLNKNLVNPNANAAAKKMFAFMQENFQKKVISGVMTDAVLNGSSAVTLNNQTEVKHIRQYSSNKTPALVGFDFMHGTGKEYEDAGGGWFKNYTDATITLAKELYQRGGIPAFCWHWRDPLKNTKGFYSPGNSGDVTNFDLTSACTNSNCTAWNTNSTAYVKMVEDIDKVAGYLKELQSAGVAVLWRPVHEASGGWFWWGGKGAAPLKLLYKLIFDRLTTYHSLNNLIWVWTSEGADYDWYPGDGYADIIGRDFYYNPQSTVNHASLIGEFEKLKNLFGTKKMITLSENGSVPYPENLVADGAGWSYFMPWNGNFVTQNNSNADWNKIMNDSYVITLESMPGWSSYNPSSSSAAVSSSSRASSSSAAISSSSRASSSSSAVSSSSSTVASSSSSGIVSSSSADTELSSSSDGETPILKNRVPITHFSIQTQSNKTLRIEINSPSVVEIYDLRGNKAISLNVSGSQTVKLSLPNGVYFAKAHGMKSIRFVLR